MARLRDSWGELAEGVRGVGKAKIGVWDTFGNAPCRCVRVNSDVRPQMRCARPAKILMADLQGDRSYLLVFSAADGSPFEVYLPGAGWPGDFAGYMTPSIRRQDTGESWELPWDEAETLGTQLLPLVAHASIAKGGEARALECVEALIGGTRYGREV